MILVLMQRFAWRGYKEEAGPEGAPGARHLREQAVPPLRPQHTGKPADRGGPKVADPGIDVAFKSCF